MSTIEHVVLFKVKDSAEPSEIDAMVDRVNSLVSLEQLLHLTMGPLLRIRSSNTSLNFTHILHSRYKSKHDLDAYTVHPVHVAVVKENAPLCEDTMALDWISDGLQQGDLVPPPGSAVRVAFFKLKEDLGDQVRDEVLGAIRGTQNDFAQVVQLSSGQNFSPGRAKGFSIASLVVFPGLSELEAADSNEELEKYQKNDKIKEHLESVLFLDYLLPSPKA